MPAHKKELSMRMRFVVSGFFCLLMAGVLLAAAFPSSARLIQIEHGQPASQAVVKAADARPRS